MVLFRSNYGNEPVRVTWLFLKMMGVRTSLRSLTDFFNSHIYKDTLLCIQDFISDSGLQTKTVKFNKSEIENVNTPFIALLSFGNGDENRYTIVSGITGNKVRLLDAASNKWKEIEKPVFIEQWTRVALLAEDRRSELVKRLSKSSWYNLPHVVILSSIILIIVLLLFRFSVTNIAVYGIWLLNLIGILISFTLVKLDFGYNNSVTSKFCNISSRFSCNEILASKGGRIFNIKWSIIGLAYFISNLMVSLVVLLFLKQLETWLFVFSCLPILFVVYSVFYQWAVEKKWCMLCLLVQGILLGQFFILLFNVNYKNFQVEPVHMYNAFLIIILVHLVSLYFINYVVVKKYDSIESSRVKFQAYKKALLQPWPFEYFSVTNELIKAPDAGVFIGNPAAQNTVLIVSSPSCRYCSDSILELLSLVRSSSCINVQILFNCKTIDAENDNKVASHFLNLQKQKPAMLNDALYYWALKKATSSDFINRFPLKEAINDFSRDIENMASWCTINSINNVPALFVNGRPLPYIYDIKDLRFVLR